MSITHSTTASMDPFRRTMNDMFDSMERDMMLAPWGGMASRFPAARMMPALTSGGGQLQRQDSYLNMHLDFHETAQGFELQADLPGMKKEDISVDVDNASGMLTVSAERHKEEKMEGTDDGAAGGEESGKRKYHYVERSYGKTTRSVHLPDAADIDNAKADYSNGVLTLSFPKKETPESRRLQIPVGDGSSDGGGGEGKQGKASIEGDKGTDNSKMET